MQTEKPVDQYIYMRDGIETRQFIVSLCIWYIDPMCLHGSQSCQKAKHASRHVSTDFPGALDYNIVGGYP